MTCSVEKEELARNVNVLLPQRQASRKWSRASLAVTDTSQFDPVCGGGQVLRDC